MRCLSRAEDAQAQGKTARVFTTWEMYSRVVCSIANHVQRQDDAIRAAQAFIPGDDGRALVVSTSYTRRASIHDPVQSEGFVRESSAMLRLEGGDRTGDKRERRATEKRVDMEFDRWDYKARLGSGSKRAYDRYSEARVG